MDEEPAHGQVLVVWVQDADSGACLQKLPLFLPTPSFMASAEEE
jgi:hypothetical protein